MAWSEGKGKAGWEGCGAQGGCKKTGDIDLPLPLLSLPSQSQALLKVKPSVGFQQLSLFAGS